MFLKSLMKRRLRAFGAAFGYDTGYLVDLVDGDVAAGHALAGLSKATRYTADAPAAAWYAAKIVAAMSEDCGPCTQLAVDMARAAGVSAEDLRAIVAGDEARMSGEAALGYRFARALFFGEGELGVARESIQRQFGRKALGAIALGAVAGRTFPRLRLALGQHETCQAVEVDGIRVAPRPGGTRRLAHA